MTSVHVLLKGACKLERPMVSEMQARLDAWHEALQPLLSLLTRHPPPQPVPNASAELT